MTENGRLDVDVVRAMGRSPVLRMEDKGAGLGTLEIRFSAFNVWYTVDSVREGKFLERTIPGTFADTIVEDRSAQRVLFDHGFDPQIGNKVLGPIDDLREEADSPVALVPLFDTSYNRDLQPGLLAGVYGSSFRMRVPKGGDSWNDRPGKSDYNPDGLPERTISKVRALEFGPVTFPANPSATAGVRSMTDHFYDQLRQRDATAYESVARAAGWLTDLTGAPDARSAGRGDRKDDQPGNGGTSTTPYRPLYDELLFLEKR
jgi:phage head maturation protease